MPLAIYGNNYSTHHSRRYTKGFFFWGGLAMIWGAAKGRKNWWLNSGVQLCGHDRNFLLVGLYFLCIPTGLSSAWAVVVVHAHHCNYRMGYAVGCRARLVFWANQDELFHVIFLLFPRWKCNFAHKDMRVQLCSQYLDICENIKYNHDSLWFCTGNLTRVEIC